MDLSRLTDGELARLFGGDSASDAFTVLYERHVRPIHDFVARTVRDLAAAEDITQRAFIQAWEQRSALRDPDAVKPWLYRVASNLALNHVTRTRPAVDIDDVAALVEAPDAGPETAALAAEAARLVWDAAASLEPRQRTVLELAVRNQLTSPEIAEVMQVAPAQASLLVHRAREALGNAVRYLLVARRRTHCERLAEMVPAGVLQLSAEQRASVDRHMRRCESCQGMASQLTRPEALLGSFLLIPLPRSLERPPHLRLTGAAIGAAGRRRRRAAALLLFVLLLGAVGGLVLLRAFTGPPGPPPAAGVGRSTPGASAVALVSPSPGVTPVPTASPTATPTPTPTLRPTAAPAPRPPTPTPLPPFAVTSISLCFVQMAAPNTCDPANTTAQTCTSPSSFTALPWSCAYRITFHLRPGAAGSIFWTLAGTEVGSCRSTIQVMASGTTSVPVGVTTVTVSPPPLPIPTGYTPNGPTPGSGASTSTATVTTRAWPSAPHNTAGFYGTGGC